MFFFSSYAAHRHLHSFPTRRSSDLFGRRCSTWSVAGSSVASTASGSTSSMRSSSTSSCRRTRAARSEEHTSELQSHSDLVCRLLLEKKNEQDRFPLYTYKDE